MYIGLQNQLQLSTNFSLSIKTLIKSVLNGFRYHPYIFMLRLSPTGKDAVHPFTHQVELLFKLFPRKPLKILIGDEIGLGKTIESIMLLKYMQEIGEVKKALVLVPRVLVTQWEGELRRFGIEPKRIERDTIDFLKSQYFPDGVYLSSIDLVKRERYKPIVLGVKWDLVVVDEAHRVGIVGGKKNVRYVFLEELLSTYPTVNVLLLSATPHRGKPDDYIQRLKLVDPNLYAEVRELDVEDFYKAINRALVFRRTKLDVNEIYEQAQVFKSCDFIAYVVEASEEEKRFHNLLVEFLRNKLLEYHIRVGGELKGLKLLLVLIAKRASSSPPAALKTFNRILSRRRAKLEGKPEEFLREVERRADEIIDMLFTSFENYGEIVDEEEKSASEDIDEVIEALAEYLAPLIEKQEVEKLEELIRLAGEVMKRDSRLNEVIRLVKDHLHKGERVVIFTVFRDTAKYIYNKLLESLPLPYRDRVCLVSAMKVEPPKALHRAEGAKYTIEDVKNWLKRGDVDVIVSTDVASEGLNLQYANVVIHYEPTWSPIKIVQRIGRVWRVGQEKNVYSYNVLLTVESDLAVFQNLYGKLLSWLIAGVESKVVIGEELKISFLKEATYATEGGVDVLSMPIGSGEEKGYSEYRAVLEYIEKGSEGLEEYIRQILSMLNQLKQVSKKVESEKGDRRVHVENVISKGLGSLCRPAAATALMKLLESTTGIEGCSVEQKSDKKTYVYCPQLGLASIESLSDSYKVVEVLTQNVNLDKPPIIVSALPDTIDFRELHLVEVVIKVSDRPVYSEVVGIAKTDAEPLRGVQLLDIISKAVVNVVSVVDSLVFSDETILKNAIAKAKYLITRSYKEYAVNPFNMYIHFVESNGLSYKHSGWEPALKSIEADARWIGSILFIPPKSTAKEPPPPIKIEEVEKKAMEFVMEFEKRNGREPEDVSKYEHYDIRSRDPRSNEVRYIEVKGRWDPTLAVELTQTEFEYAKKLGKDYWLYIVYDIGSEKPKLVMIRDPATNVVWKTKVNLRYELVGIKREAVETGGATI